MRQWGGEAVGDVGVRRRSTAGCGKWAAGAAGAASGRRLVDARDGWVVRVGRRTLRVMHVWTGATTWVGQRGADARGGSWIPNGG